MFYALAIVVAVLLSLALLSMIRFMVLFYYHWDG